MTATAAPRAAGDGQDLDPAALKILRRATHEPIPARLVDAQVLNRLRRARLVVVEPLQAAWSPSNHCNKAPHVLATLAGAQLVEREKAA